MSVLEYKGFAALVHMPPHFEGSKAKLMKYYPRKKNHFYLDVFLLLIFTVRRGTKINAKVTIVMSLLLRL